jgi:hypothetical protein
MMDTKDGMANMAIMTTDNTTMDMGRMQAGAMTNTTMMIGTMDISTGMHTMMDMRPDM